MKRDYADLFKWLAIFLSSILLVIIYGEIFESPKIKKINLELQRINPEVLDLLYTIETNTYAYLMQDQVNRIEYEHNKDLADFFEQTFHEMEYAGDIIYPLMGLIRYLEVTSNTNITPLLSEKSNKVDKAILMKKRTIIYEYLAKRKEIYDYYKGFQWKEYEAILKEEIEFAEKSKK